MKKKLSFMKLLYKLKYALPPIITALVYFAVLFIKGIYPFGNLTVDYYDMAQQIAAFYYHIFDVLHGTKSLFYDPYTAMSVNMSMSTSGCSHLSIFNLFFLFIKRDMLLESLSWFLGLKMMLMSVAMYIYVHKIKKIPYYFEVLISVGYAFCGFVMVLYVTIQWMDIAVLFPIIMLFLHVLLTKGRSIGYIVFLTLSIVSSYYISFMILIYIVLFVGLEIFAERVFENRSANKKTLHLTALLTETAVSLLLSSFIVIPQLRQTLMSARFNNESEGGPINMYLEIINTVKPAYTTRWFSLLGLSFAFAIIAAGIFRNRKNKKVLFLSIMSVVLVTAELFIESINLIWHFGSYVQYPIRNGFIIYFTVSMVAACFIEQENISLSGFSHVIIAAVIMIFALYLGIRAYNMAGVLPVRKVFHLMALIMGISFCICLFFYTYGKGKLSAIIPVIVLSEMIFYGVVFIGQPSFVTGYSEEPEQEGEYIRICNQISDVFDLKPDKEGNYLLSRIKNPDESLNANYGLVLRRPTLSNWTHLLNPGLSDTSQKMGYSVQFTRLLDAGGTVFSDALIGVRNVISCIPQNEKLYTLLESKSLQIDKKTGKTALYNYYNCNYQLPFGYVVNDSEKIDFSSNDTSRIYNDIYHSMGGDGDISQWMYNDEITENPLVSKKLGSVISFDYNCYAGRNMALYYFADQVDRDDYNTEISVNGEIVQIPSIKETDNTLYPAHFNNNSVFLGVFDNEFVEINVRFTRIGKDGETIDANFSPKILSVELQKLEDLCNKKNQEINTKASKNRYVFEVVADGKNELMIPLSFDKGYRATVNSNKTEVKSVGDMFISVPLSEGNNIVEIRFVPDGLQVGIAISLAVLAIALVGFYFTNKKKMVIPEFPFIENICFVGYIAVIAAMYIIPVFYGVYKCIM